MKPSDYEAVSQAGTREEFRGALSSFAAQLDFPLVNALLIDGDLSAPDLRIAAVGNTPPTFLVTHADLKRIRVDPVMQRLQSEPTPFAWDQGFYARRGFGHLWEDQAPHGYRVGIAASIAVGDGQRLFVGIDRHDPLPSSEPMLTRLQADLQLLAVHAQVAARRLLGKPAASEMSAMRLPHLAPRELDVLKWTDQGKTAYEVGVILGMKERTVNSYLESAKDKLGVVGKKELAVKVAKALGLLQGL